MKKTKNYLDFSPEEMELVKNVEEQFGKQIAIGFIDRIIVSKLLNGLPK